LLTLIVSKNAQAHVKWFAHYDLSKPPEQVGLVFTSEFTLLLLLSIALLLVYYCIDRYCYRRQLLDSITQRITVNDNTAFLIMRAATFVFFFGTLYLSCLWYWFCAYPGIALYKSTYYVNSVFGSCFYMA